MSVFVNALCWLFLENLVWCFVGGGFSFLGDDEIWVVVFKVVL